MLARNVVLRTQRLIRLNSSVASYLEKVPANKNSKFIEELEMNDQVVVTGSNYDGSKPRLHIESLVSNMLSNRNSRKNNLGLLILTCSKEMSAEIYKQVKVSDPDRKLNVARMGSISYISPKVTSGDRYNQQSNLKCHSTFSDEESLKNLATVAEDSDLDVLIATPGQLGSLSAWSRVFNAEVAVLEDFEMQTQEFNISLERILSSMDSESKLVWATRHNKPPVSPTASRRFPELESLVDQAEEIYQPTENDKFITASQMTYKYKLLELLRKNKDKRGIIFCRSQQDAALLSQVLSKNQVKTFLYSATTNTPLLMWNLISFKMGRPSVLVSHDAAIRNVDTPEADYSIWLDSPLDEQDEYYRRRTVSASTPTYRLSVV